METAEEEAEFCVHIRKHLVSYKPLMGVPLYVKIQRLMRPPQSPLRLRAGACIYLRERIQQYSRIRMQTKVDPTRSRQGQK